MNKRETPWLGCGTSTITTTIVWVVYSERFEVVRGTKSMKQAANKPIESHGEEGGGSGKEEELRRN